MFNENEVAMLLLCSGVFIFVITKRQMCKRIPRWELIFSGFCMFFFAVIFTITEHLIFPTILNILEHLFYMCSSLLILIWCWMTFHCDKRGN